MCTLFFCTCVGLDQAGLPATIAHAISCLPADIQGMFWANIGLVGGCAKFAGFRARLYVLSPFAQRASGFFYIIFIHL